MDWRFFSAVPFVLWVFYAVFSSLANKAHGEKVTMAVEALAMVIVASVVLLIAGINDFRQATTRSLTYAGILAFCSAVGVLSQFYAFKIAPPGQQGAVGMIGGMYPILAVLIFYGMYLASIEGGANLSSRQWLGVLGGAMSLWLVSGK